MESLERQSVDNFDIYLVDNASVDGTVVEKIGCMPEENFIYYDDITWGVRCHRAGYRVVANSHATVWHKGGAAINPTTFANYYLNRNKVRFFMTYIPSLAKGTHGRKRVSFVTWRRYFQSAYVQYASFKCLAGRKIYLFSTLRPQS